MGERRTSIPYLTRFDGFEGHFLSVGKRLLFSAGGVRCGKPARLTMGEVQPLQPFAVGVNW
jgi:hypothetical protein